MTSYDRKGEHVDEDQKQLGYQTPPALVNQMISTKGQAPYIRLLTTLQKSQRK